MPKILTDARAFLCGIHFNNWRLFRWQNCRFDQTFFFHRVAVRCTVGVMNAIRLNGWRFDSWRIDGDDSHLLMFAFRLAESESFGCRRNYRRLWCRFSTSFL